MSVTVYAKQHCPQCDATKRQFAKQGVDFDLVDLTDNRELVDEFIAKGFRQTPIVVTDEETWSGYRPDLIRKVAEAAKVYA